MQVNSLLEARRAVAQRVAQIFIPHPLVTAIIVFGSVASDIVDEFSDVDILLVCEPDLLTLLERRAILNNTGYVWTSHESQRNGLFAETDECPNVDEIAVTIHYQRVSWVNQVLRAVIEQGAITTDKMPFRPYTLPALLQRGWLLYDRDLVVDRWREETTPFPTRLKQNIIAYFLPILREESDELASTARRELRPRNFLFHLNRSVDALISILYVVNDIFDPADRRASQTVWPFLQVAPVNFVSRLTSVLEGPFDPKGMKLQAQRYSAIVDEALEILTEMMG